ncbi:MAG: hypothetical protein HQL73_12040 [Magnetococcales bacterium]|nr:hypothetical protein [Magnetococcales bacterium]
MHKFPMNFVKKSHHYRLSDDVSVEFEICVVDGIGQFEVVWFPDLPTKMTKSLQRGYCSARGHFLATLCKEMGVDAGGVAVIET